ncbi:MAG: M48 family metallopeptidase [Pseudolabrys sp.]
MADAVNAAAVNAGRAIYFDGVTSARHDAWVTLDAGGLRIAGRDGQLLAYWPIDETEGLPAPGKVLRLGRRGNEVLARLEVFDSVLAAEIDRRAEYVDRTGGRQRRQRWRVVFWTIAATASLVAVAIFGVPVIADGLTPAVPLSVERKLGDAIDARMRGLLDRKNLGTGFECGHAARERAGAAALGKMMKRLNQSAALRLPVTATVLRRPEANAMALPGARIDVFQGLIAKADTPDELAGVIAHEIGHVAHRDGTRSVLQAGGLSLMFGMLLGDFVGGGAVVIAARSVLRSSYSRRVETAADAYGARLMNKAGGDARALGVILGKIGGATEPGMDLLLDHPETKARIRAIDKLAAPGHVRPWLTPHEWAALKRICAG